MAGITTGSGQLYLDQFLSNFSLSYMQSTKLFAADKVSRRVPVEKRSGQYPIWSKAEDFRIDTVGYRRPGADATEIDSVKTNGTYNCLTYAKKVSIPDELVNDGGNVINIRTRKTRELSQAMLKMREYRVATQATTAGNYGANTAAAGAAWDDYYTGGNTSDPLLDINKAIKGVLTATGVRPNRIVIPALVAVVLRNHPKFVSRFTSWTGTVETIDLPPTIEGCTTIIAGGFWNTANRNTSNTATVSGLWGKNIILFYEEDEQMDQPSPETLTTFKTFDYTLERVVNRWYEAGKQAEFVQANESIDEEITAADTGYLVTGVLS